MNTAALKWELTWIRNTLHRYDSIVHAMKVSNNIIERYYINAVKAKLLALGVPAESLDDHVQSFVAMNEVAKNNRVDPNDSRDRALFEVLARPVPDGAGAIWSMYPNAQPV